MPGAAARRVRFIARKGRTVGGAPCNAIVSIPTAFTPPALAEREYAAAAAESAAGTAAPPAGASFDPDPHFGEYASDAAASVEITRKRRKGYPSESRVQRGRRFVHGGKELVEKLGRNDPCPCGSTRRFKALLPRRRAL